MSSDLGKYWKNGFSHWEMEPNNWQFGLKTGKYNGFIGLILGSEWSYWKSKIANTVKYGDEQC